MDNKIYMIDGSMGSGKSLLMTILASEYEYIYANYQIFSEFSKFKKMEYREDIFGLAERRSEKKGCLIIDEAQKYLNRRNSMTGENKEIGNLVVLSRKANLDIYFIPQNAARLDEQLTWFVDVKITMLNSRKYIDEYGRKEVDLTYCTQKKSYDVERKGFTRVYIDIEKTTERCIYILEQLRMGYDTLDSVELTSKKRTLKGLKVL